MTAQRKASCGIEWIDGEAHLGHAVVDSSPDLAFFQSGDTNTKQCEICGYYEEPHLRVTSVAKGAKRIDDHAFVPRAPLPFDTYYCGCRGWD